MRLLVDANLSPVVAEKLREHDFDATHVVDHGLVTASDETIAAFAVANGMAIVSTDSDFATLLAISKGTAPSLVLFRSIDALTPAEQGALIAANLDTVAPALEEGAVVSMRRGHIRVRPLPLA